MPKKSPKLPSTYETAVDAVWEYFLYNFDKYFVTREKTLVSTVFLVYDQNKQPLGIFKVGRSELVTNDRGEVVNFDDDGLFPLGGWGGKPATEAKGAEYDALRETLNQIIMRALDYRGKLSAMMKSAPKKKRNQPKPNLKTQTAIYLLSHHRLKQLRERGIIPELTTAMEEIGGLSVKQLGKHAPELKANWGNKTYRRIWEYNEDKGSWELLEL